MKVLDLFSGIGGFSLGLERAGMETVAFCEIDPYAQRVLKKHWPDVPLFEDITKLKGEDVGSIDLICGGYPCQPFSTAGKRQGKEDDRHLWPEYLRLIRELRPRWVIGENVAGHISMGLDTVLSDLEGEGYTWQTFVIPACAVDAKHQRDRVWILATNTEHLRSAEQERKHQWPEIFDGGSKNRLVSWNDVANSAGERQSRQGQSLKSMLTEEEGKRQAINAFSGGERAIWSTEPGVGRVANGVPRRVDRLRCLGNAVVPQIPEIIGNAIMEIEATA